jgi:anti-sigma factor RsiW
VSDPLFRLVCAPSTLTSSPDGWAVEMLRDGAVAVTADADGLPAIAEAARTLGVTAIPVVRGEASPEEQERTVIAHAGSLALVWVAPAFTDEVRAWAQERGPMTLLVAVDGELPADERRRVERFVAILSGQAA